MVNHQSDTLIVFDDIAGIFSLVFDSVVVQPLYSINVEETDERPWRGFERWVELFDQSGRRLIGEETINGFTDLGRDVKIWFLREIDFAQCFQCDPSSLQTW
jgi:hypothetical protein